MLTKAALEEGPEVGAFIAMLLDAGLRRGEALALRWRSVACREEGDPRRIS